MENSELTKLSFRKSSACASSACVEVAIEKGRVHLRNSKSASKTLMFDVDEWTAFVAGVRSGEFEARY
jgi:hypothetical protein